ncbi:hypothetical protein PE066_01780 [Ramlibacter tataouinensis]|uniref:hypothetical protein n=1 Tax=Ramlibacter tataouinensis TaxID=94132 RepID=UPI0022F39F65|nr:hypothetical protein [Ramlibacter tataouinensis]WBY02285.1 hypothetical protein PE066_01780 [Ramlibacter tataouinensis]
MAMFGIAAGIIGHVWWINHAAKARRRIPRHWPLDSRRMANSQECRVWRWLVGVFPDQHVMVKLPVTRFTLPRAGENSEYWYQLLGGVYCTFTVCRSDGQVVGCVDVPGPKGLSRSNRHLKLMLLSQCGISYWVARPGRLPDAAEIRAEFLGEQAVAPASHEDEEQAKLAAAKEKLLAALHRQRDSRQQARAAGRAGSDSDPTGLLGESDFAPAAWQQPNSFIAPLDSRPARLC